MLEAKVDALTEAVKEQVAQAKEMIAVNKQLLAINKALLEKAGGTVPAASGDKPAGGKKDTPPADSKPSITAAELRKIAVEYRDKHGPEKTVALINETTGAPKIADVKEADFDKMAAAFKAALAAKADDDI